MTEGSETSPTILLFARGILALLDLWPALTIAVAEEWGGPESSEKKTWIASIIIDEFESRATYLPAPVSDASGPSVPTPPGPTIDPADATDPPLDQDDLIDLLTQIMEDEFEARLEDGSIEGVASDIVRLWKGLFTEQSPEAAVESLERRAQEVKKSGVQASKGAQAEDDDSSSEGDEGDMEVDGEEAPQLVQRENMERQEPVVDDDGFTLVQKSRRR
ncbi:hypothetical protein L204_104893 [Cryptococcus depauperatus]|nr:pre-rRNA-processing protein TSR2 [Cryptococcus depauperatus CBS 7855]